MPVPEEVGNKERGRFRGSWSRAEGSLSTLGGLIQKPWNTRKAKKAWRSFPWIKVVWGLGNEIWLEFPERALLLSPPLPYQSALDLDIDFRTKSIFGGPWETFLTLNGNNSRTLQCPTIGELWKKPVVCGTVIIIAHLCGRVAKCQVLGRQGKCISSPNPHSI